MSKCEYHCINGTMYVDLNHHEDVEDQYMRLCLQIEHDFGKDTLERLLEEANR